MQSHIDRKLNSNANLKNIYTDMYRIATGFTKKKGGTFVLRPYQVLVAATIAAKKSTYTAMKLGAGQGKSFICLLLAAYHRSKNQPVTIVVTSRLL